MTARRLLYLSIRQMSAYRWQNGVLTEEGHFFPTQEGQSAFSQYLAANPRSVFTLLANIPDEGFHIETIPFLRGGDRRAVITRKIGQQFFNAPLTAFQSLGHEKSSRRDERLLLTALTNAEFFSPWLAAIDSTETSLSGIYSLPLMAPALLRKLRLENEPSLLITFQDRTVRQSYFEKGELQFSRLTRISDTSIAGIAQAFAAEATKLHQYLVSQRTVSRTQQLRAHILLHASALNAVQMSCIDTPNIRFNLISLEECARVTGLRSLPTDSSSERLFLHLLIAAPATVQFANDRQRHHFHINRIRSALYGIGTIALAGCLLVSGRFLLEARAIGTETAALHAEEMRLHQRYADIVSAFPKVPVDNDTLRRIINRWNDIARQNGRPHAVLAMLSRALDKAPAIVIDQLEWNGGALAEIERSGAEQTADTIPAPKHEALIVQGHILHTATTSTRQLLFVFTQFLELLKMNESHRIDVLLDPVSVDPGRTMRGDEATTENDRERPFRIRILRRPNP